MKKKVFLAAGCLLLIVAAWLVASGFFVQPTAYLTEEYTVADDGSAITFHIAVASSMGGVRGYHDLGGGDKPHYLKFYSAWGGLNSTLGAKDEYTLPLNPEDTEIYVYHGGGGYTLALVRDEDGVWRRAKEDAT